MMQLFGKQSTSEVRLSVDAPLEEGQEFARCMYNRQDHEDILYHHNYKTRMEHAEATNRIRISFDQHAAHAIFAQWKERALQDADISGIQDPARRREWTVARIQELDHAFDRALGLRMSEQLRDDVLGSGQQMMQTGLNMADPLFDKVKKLSTGRMWRRNISGGVKRGRITTAKNAGFVLGGNSRRKAQQQLLSEAEPAAAASSSVVKDMDEMEEGEI